jgi:cytochrome c2
VLLILVSGFIVKKISSSTLLQQNSNIVIGHGAASKSDALSAATSNGKILFFQKCATCHNLFKDQTGPSLIGFEERGPWSDRQNLYLWIRHPSAFMKKNPYARKLKEMYGSMMTAFPDLSDDEIDNIVAYINYVGNQREFL